LMIGVNWFLLVYVTGAACLSISNNFIAAIISSLMMVLLDFLIEPVAIKLDFWTWQSDHIPVSNYLGWFAVALLIQLIYRLSTFDKKNSIAIFLLLCLAIFFGILGVIL